MARIKESGRKSGSVKGERWVCDGVSRQGNRTGVSATLVIAHANSAERNQMRYNRGTWGVRWVLGTRFVGLDKYRWTAKVRLRKGL